MKFCLVTLLTCLINLSSTIPSHGLNRGPVPVYRYPPPSVRGRPLHGYKGINFKRWHAPPGDWLEGKWYLVNSSYAGWAENFADMQVQHFSAGSYKSEDLLFSWSACPVAIEKTSQCADAGNKTARGHNDPIWARGPTEDTHRATWNFSMDGQQDIDVPGFFSSLMAWGTDTSDADYYVVYHTDSNEVYGSGEGSISLASRAIHVSQNTLDEVMNGIKQLAVKLEDKDLRSLVEKIKPITHKDERTSQSDEKVSEEDEAL